jgi:hypothetical protein
MRNLILVVRSISKLFEIIILEQPVFENTFSFRTENPVNVSNSLTKCVLSDSHSSLQVTDSSAAAFNSICRLMDRRPGGRLKGDKR